MRNELLTWKNDSEGEERDRQGEERDREVSRRRDGKMLSRIFNEA